MAQIALITGGSRGIGAATTKAFAQAGFAVCLSYNVDKSAAETVANECRGLGVEAIAVEADVSNPIHVDRLFEICDEKLGQPSVLVNNAGVIGSPSLLSKLSHSDLNRTFSVNVFGAVYCAQQAILRMAKSHGGAGGVIINISSMASKTGSPGEYVHYSASKGAIDSLTIGLAKELGHEGIRVNAIRAGTTNTEIHSTSGNPDRPEMIARMAPLGRVAEPNDIAQAVLWMASDNASYASGSILDIAGGLV